MSHRSEKRARKAQRSARAALVTAITFESVCATMPGISRAQEARAGNEEQLQEVVVTGFRQSLESALNDKRNSDLPIESVAPEDLGKMPDQNVAEALQRLPGLQIDRAGGQGTQVLIDGLRQNLTTLNGDIFLTGRELYVSGEASGGGAGGNAQYNSLEGIPSENISGIDVYKNPKASMVEGGLGGTIDLKTRDPLALPDGLTIGGNARGTISDGTGGATPDATLVGGFKLNDRIALTGSLSYDKERTHTKEFQDQNRNQWTITNSATPPYTGALAASDYGTLPQYYIDPQLAYLSDINDERVIQGANLGIAVAVTDAIHSRLNWFYAGEDDESFTYSDKVWFNGQGGQVTTNSSGGLVSPLIPGIDPTKPYSIDGNGVVRSATFNANGAETATLYQHAKDRANNFQWLNTFDNGGPVKGSLAAYYSRATSNLQAAQADIEHGLYETSAGVATSPSAPGCNNGAPTCDTDPNGNHGYQFNWSNGGTSGLPRVSYLSPYADVLSNPAYATFKSNWAWANYTQQEQKAFKLDVAWNPANVPMATLSAGSRYATRDVNQVFGRYLINGTLANGQVAGNVSDPNGGPYDYYQDPGYGTPNIPYSTGTTNPALLKSYNNFAVGSIGVKNPYVGGMTNPGTYLNTVWSGAGVPNTTETFFEDGLSSFHVHERTTAVYLMGDIGRKEDHFHVNFGVRVVGTDLSIDNGQSAVTPTYYGTAIWNGVDSNVIPVETNRHYVDVLPSLNLSFDLSDTQILRLGAARVTSPQDLFLLGLGNSYNYTRVTDAGRTNIHNGTHDGFAFANGTSGNPRLDPYRASQFLLSWENYFARGALASVSTFWKQIDSFVTLANIPTQVLDDFGGTTANVLQPVNAGAGRIYGLEVGGQYAFDWNWLDGFGVAANYTLSESTSNQTTSFTQHSQIPGVSQNAFTTQAYYEKLGFSARLSYSWRSRAVNDSLVGPTFSFPDQTGTQRVYQVYQAPYGQLDAQVGYDFSPHLGLVLSAQNLTRESLHTYLQFPNLPFTYDDWGRRYFFGIKFRN
jgi:iron complex outermembrane recepter protein